MEYKSAQVFSSLLVILFLTATVSSEYVFNGFRGSFIPNNMNKNENSVTTNTITTDNYNNNNNNNPSENRVEPNYNGRCVQQSDRDLRAIPGYCNKFQMCSSEMLITFFCSEGTAFSSEMKACVPKGSNFDTCREEVTNPIFVPGVRPQTTLCPRGATYKKAHPVHCARYYDCSKPAMMSRWEDHEWECKYPFLFNEDTRRCEHYSMVACGTRKIAYDKCDYKQYGCNGHAHCRPCTVENPTCRSLPDGMNVWLGRTPSPYYVVCSQQRVVYSGTCPSGQIFDSNTGTCVISNSNWTW